MCGHAPSCIPDNEIDHAGTPSIYCSLDAFRLQYRVGAVFERLQPGRILLKRAVVDDTVVDDTVVQDTVAAVR